jgi:hypothetical protein
MIRDEEIRCVRKLAEKVKEIARNPVHEENRERWALHNSLKSTEPLLLIFPEGSWSELIPEESIVCEDTELRSLELDLRKRIFYAEHLKDDAPILDEIVVTKKVLPFDWGLQPERVMSDSAKGAYEIKPVLLDPSDADKLRIPEVVYDEKGTLERFETIGNTVGDILPVRLKGEQHIGFHLMSAYIAWRGLDSMLLDFYLQPDLIHRVMQFLVDANNSIVNSMLEKGLLSYNSDQSYQSSGGNGYITGELNGDEKIQGPYRNFGKSGILGAGEIDFKRMWCSAESQELAVVGPDHHREFALQYEAQLLNRFGLSGYGCCEDLTSKLDDVIEMIPNIRRISISPWADVDRCAERLQGDYIFSWKPNPVHLVGAFDEKLIRDYIRGMLEKTQKEGNVTEIILKDTHTCEFHPERFFRWVDIYREEAARI